MHSKVIKEIKSEPLIEKARIAGTEKLDNSDVTFYAIKIKTWPSLRLNVNSLCAQLHSQIRSERTSLAVFKTYGRLRPVIK